MATRLTTKADENSTYIITASFTDEDDNTVVPNTLTWTLVDMDGNVINERQDIVVSSLASSINIVLSGNDLALSGSSKTEERIITLEGTYDSSSGSNLPIVSSASFKIQENLGV